MTRARAIQLGALAAALILAAACILLCTVRVPDGQIGLRSRGGRVVGLFGSGTHLRRPSDRVVMAPSGRRDFSGTLETTTKEGASIRTPYRLTLDLSAADPERLSFVADHLASGSSLEDSVAAALLQAVAGGAPGGPAGALAGLGLVPGSLSLGAAEPAAGAGGPPPASASNPLSGVWSPPKSAVLLIGIDSADWDLMTPLIDSGALPNLKALRDRGAWATLRSMTPTLSPILWTTIATGRRPEDHGIIDFLMKDPATGSEVPISRQFRKVKALWNIASDLRLPNTTIAWWATWPAERVTGAMVTDRVAYSLFDLPSSTPQAGLVYPESLMKEVAAHSVEAESITYDDVRALIDVPQAAFDRARGAIDSPEGYKDPICHLIKVLASTRTYHELARSLVHRQAGGLSMVYYEGLDEVNHRFAHYMPPAMGLVKSADRTLAAAFATAVPGFYRLQDRMVGELIAAAPRDTVVMVVSDHGFANGKERPVDTPPDIEGTPGLWHTLDGVLIVAGPPIQAGHMEKPPGLLDVAPTLLALMGLPPAADMPGHVMSGIFRKEAPPKTAAISIASYDAIGEPLQRAGAAAATSQDPEMMAKLKALGYVGSAGDAAAPADSSTPVYHVNAGHLFLGRNQLDQAQAEFARAHEMAPNFDQPLLGLAQVHLQRGRPADALEPLEKALGLPGEIQPALLTRIARVYIKAGQTSRGWRFLSGLSWSGRREAFRLTALGMLAESDGRPEEALQAYQKALVIDPSVERALYGAYLILKKQGRLEELATLLRGSLDAEPAAVAVKVANWLALTRELQGQRPEARTILATALEKSPDDPMTLVNLGSMLVRDDRAGEGIGHLERAYAAQPKSFEVLVNLIVAHGKLGSLDKARRYFQEGEAVARRPELYNAIAYACFLNGATRDAQGYLDRSLALDPAQKEARMLKEQMERKGHVDHGGR